MAVSTRLESISSAVLMICALITGALLAAGHHLFYAGLAGSDAPTGHYHIAGGNVSKQQFNTAVGTTFAFLVKASLTLAVSVAYTQAFWRAARTAANGRQLSTLDTTFSALSNILAFVKVHVWFRYPLLLALAVIVWLIPTASIVTPATLSVQSAPDVPSRSKMANVPQLGFSSLNYVAPMPVGGRADGLDQAKYCYAGPSQSVERLSTAVGAQGSVLSIPSQAANVSWELDFWAPSLECNSVEGQDRQDIWENIYNYLAGKDCDESPAYIAWTPSSRELGPYDLGSNSSKAWKAREPDIAQGEQAVFYVTVLPGMFEGSVSMPSHIISGGCALTAWGDSYKEALNTSAKYVNPFLGDSLLLECGVRNTSYSAAFKYGKGAQAIQLDVRDTQEFLQPIQCLTGPHSTSNGIGNMSAGISQMKNADCSTLNTKGKPCEFDIEVARRISYQGIADAFLRMISGHIGFDWDGSAPSVVYDSDVAKTVLLDTTELAAFPVGSVGAGFSDLPSIIELSNGTAYPGLSYNRTLNGTRGPLKEALQDMFTNLTLSMMSEPNLWPDYASQFAPEQNVNVTFPAWHNIYVYDWKTLWIAYGLATGFSTLAVACGLVIFCLNGAGYDDSFSTILRVSRMATVTDGFGEKEGEGALPLPQDLAKARVIMNGSSSRSHVGREYATVASQEEKSAASLSEVDESLLRRRGSAAG